MAARYLSFLLPIGLAVGATVTTTTELEKLGNLFNEGLLTSDQFEQFKERLLATPVTGETTNVEAAASPLGMRRRRATSSRSR